MSGGGSMVNRLTKSAIFIKMYLISQLFNGLTIGQDSSDNGKHNHRTGQAGHWHAFA